MDLTELVEDPFKGMDYGQSVAEFERRLSVIQSEFENIEPEVFKFETVDCQACVLECARLWTRLQKLRGTRSGVEDAEVCEPRYLLRDRVRVPTNSGLV